MELRLGLQLDGGGAEYMLHKARYDYVCMTQYAHHVCTACFSHDRAACTSFM